MAAGETTADDLKLLIERLIIALDAGTFESRRLGGSRPTMLSIMELSRIDEIGDEAKAMLPELLSKVLNAEARAGTTARAAAVAGAMDPATLGHLRDLLGSLGVPGAATPTPKVTAFLADTYTSERRLREDAHRHVAGYVNLFAKGP